MTDLASASPARSEAPQSQRVFSFLRNVWRMIRRGRNGDSSVRDTLEELIEERDDADQPINADERILLANILELRVRTVHDVMVPRADIIAIAVDTMYSEIIDTITREGHSRLPVFGESLDDSIGFIHAKDVASAVFLSFKMKKTGIFNIGSVGCNDFLSLAKILVKILKSKSKISLKTKKNVKSLKSLDVKINKAKATLKWNPSVTISKGLKMTVRNRWI